ncbi:MAG TPA: MFS transporter [Anaerolineaceae bacterium]
MLSLRRIFQPSQAVPDIYRSNFRNLYFDVAWFGVMQGTILSFLQVYCARLGASPQQIGWVAAAPGLMNLLLSLPVGEAGKRLPPARTTRWTALITRSFYLLLVVMPFFLGNAPQMEIGAIIALILVLNIPGTVSVVMGNTFFAETVPTEYRGQVVATRNALLAGTTMLASLVSGQILNRMSFPAGYQVVFAIGLVGGLVSAWHLFQIRPLVPEAPVRLLPGLRRRRLPVGEAEAGGGSSMVNRMRATLRLDILRSPFGKVVLLMFLFYFSLFVGFPMGPVYQVNVLLYTDQMISFGTAIFYTVLFLGSTQVGRLTRRFGYKPLAAVGVSLVGVSMGLFVVSYNLPILAVTNTVAGIGWAMINTGVINYIYERTPDENRPAHLAWYNMAMNGAMLSGSIIGSNAAALFGLVPAMLTVAVLRILAGVALLKSK